MAATEEVVAVTDDDRSDKGDVSVLSPVSAAQTATTP